MVTIHINRKAAIWTGLCLMMLPGIIGFPATVGAGIIGAIALGMAQLIDYSLTRAGTSPQLPDPQQHRMTQWNVSGLAINVRWPKMIKDNQR